MALRDSTSPESWSVVKTDTAMAINAAFTPPPMVEKASSPVIVNKKRPSTELEAGGTPVRVSNRPGTAIKRQRNESPHSSAVRLSGQLPDLDRRFSTDASPTSMMVESSTTNEIDASFTEAMSEDSRGDDDIDIDD